MPILNLDFLNKNQFRSFPLKAEALRVAEDGRVVKDDLLTACSISTVISRTDLHIAQIYVQGNYISLTLGCVESGRVKALGYFKGVVLDNFTTLNFMQFDRFTGGCITLGNASTLLDMAGGYYFEPSALPLEESTIFYYTPPEVKAICRKFSQLRGNVVFGNLSNLQKYKNADNKTISLGVTSNNSLESLVDKSSDFNNCRTPAIYYVNGTKPFYNAANPLHQGNMYLVGVQPVVFYGSMGEGSLELATKLESGEDLKLQALCGATSSMLPPIDPAYLVNRVGESPAFRGKEKYYAKSFSPPENALTHDEPEFLSWPQFFKNFYKFVSGYGNNLNASVLAAGTKQVGTIHRLVLSNLEAGQVQVTLTVNGNIPEGFDSVEIKANTRIVKKFINPVSIGIDTYVDMVVTQNQQAPIKLDVRLFYR
jgi:hypothetical protein